MDIDEVGGPPNSAEINKILQIIYDVSSILGLIFSFPMIFVCASSESNFLVKAFFWTSIAFFHLISIIRTVFPKFVISADMKERLILCPDVHYFTVMFLFLVSGICPFFYVLLYCLIFAARGIPFMVEQIQLAKTNPVLANRLTGLLDLPVFCDLPAYLEILLGLRLVFLLIFDFCFSTAISVLTYLLWLLLFNYANSEVHARVWSSISIFIREFAAKKADSFGPQLEKFVDRAGEISDKMIKLYPSKELKVHLQ